MMMASMGATNAQIVPYIVESQQLQVKSVDLK